MEEFDSTKFFAEIASNIIVKHAKDFFSAVAKRLKREVNKLKVDFDLAFSVYLSNAYSKYSTIKTILNKVEPRPFYEFFETPYLRKGSAEPFLAKTVDDVLDISHFSVIQGTGGIGKSTLMKHLFLDELKTEGFIPIFIELKDINELGTDYDVRDFLFRKLMGLGETLDADTLDYALKTGCFLFLLDGYDEVFSDKRNLFFSKFEYFCDAYPDNYYLISSRPFSDFVYMQRFTLLETLPFNKAQTVSLAKKFPFDEEIKARFVETLDRELYDKHESFASNPLLLSIMLLTFREYAEIPDKLHLFYANAFETLFSKHDATKSGLKREFRSGLGFDEFRKVFSCFCFATYSKGKTEFTRDELRDSLKKIAGLSGISGTVPSVSPDDFIYDLVNCVCLLYPDGMYYCFSHRSFQEYFTAYFLKELSDEDMRKYGIRLIKGDTLRAAQDNVFKLLRDMARDRFEADILLPPLDEAFDGIPENELYDRCFSEQIGMVGFHYSTHSDGSEAMLVDAAWWYNDRLSFCYRMYKEYYCTVDDYEYAKRTAAKGDPLWDRMMSKYPSVACGISVLEASDVIADTELYELIKSSNLGLKLNEFIALREKLKKKKASMADELDELFN